MPHRSFYGPVDQTTSVWEIAFYFHSFKGWQWWSSSPQKFVAPISPVERISPPLRATRKSRGDSLLFVTATNSLNLGARVAAVLFIARVDSANEGS